jgi:hypothetical protein
VDEEVAERRGSASRSSVSEEAEGVGKRTHLDVETVLFRSQSRDLVLLRSFLPKVLRLEDIAQSIRSREHGRVKFHPNICRKTGVSEERKKRRNRRRTESLPVERNKLHSRRPHMMRCKVTARQSTRLRIRPRQMPSVVGDEVLPRRLVPQHFRNIALTDGDDVRRGVLLFLVEAASFDANGVDEEGRERVGHGEVFLLRRGRRKDLG